MSSLELIADGTKSVEGLMLVGVEGIYSKVAKQLSGGKLKVYDTGARGIHGQAPSMAFKGLGEGVFRIRDNTRSNSAIFAITNVRSSNMGDPNIQFGWTMGGNQARSAPNDDYTIVGKRAADIAKSLTKDWHPRFKPLFEQMDQSELPSGRSLVQHRQASQNGLMSLV
jgi:hypothetical protein